MATLWLEIAVATAPSYVDELAGLIASEVPAAGQGLVVREREVAFWVESGDEDAALASLESFLRRLEDHGSPVVAGSAEVRPTPPEKEWREAYKRYFRVARLSRQIVVVPSWETYEAAADDLVIHLDPGQAFGTGSHATTTLVLRELQRLADGGLRAERGLDAGTGSGILAIAMGKLGLAGDLVAFDNDPLAVSAATENCENNAVDALIERREGPDLERPGYGLIVANIQRPVLLALADDLTAVAEPARSTLVLSGLLAPELDELVEAYEERGWREVRREIDADDTDWGVLTFARSGR